MQLAEIEGIGAAYATKLEAAGIASVEDLLTKGATPAGRDAIAAGAGITTKLIGEWVNHADLMRIKGVGSEYADLLEAAGVDTIPELAQRVPANLATRLTEVNDAKSLVRRVPTESEVTDWVSQAKNLPRVITY